MTVKSNRRKNPETWGDHIINTFDTMERFIDPHFALVNEDPEHPIKKYKVKQSDYKGGDGADFTPPAL